MKKNKIIVSSDKFSIFIASMALIATVFTTYIQFFHKNTNFSIGDINSTLSQNDSLNTTFDIEILFLNTGKNPVAIKKWSTFLSSDKSKPQGVCYSNSIFPTNNSLFTFSCNSNINKIVEPNTLNFIKLNLNIDKNQLKKYAKTNNVNTEENKFEVYLGVVLKFIDSQGKKITNELIIRKITFFKSNNILQEDIKIEKDELKIY
ncbi:hypothetical protein [Polaribacter porphyrae]|uniref:Uncharacterized protein n=1 Tax=Polaribacter porphyrae TaxID=1137780 RepID=A0A2S7WNC8_9FLAO|nr:hypothetical protein [Polaribacter porphyrae]PQJ79100.1 hypothetical protein BTO18_07925 [Polaribacter porphyrae]